MDETDGNISDISSASFAFPSTPTTSRKRSHTAATSTPIFKAPKATKSRIRKGPIFGVCDKCGKDYVRKKNYDDHMRLHALVDANSRYPDSEQILCKMLMLSQKVVEKMSKIESVGTVGKQHNAFVKHLLQSDPVVPEWSKFCTLIGKRFVEALITGKFLLPSALLPIVYKVADSMLTDAKFRQECFEFLETVDPMSNSEAMLQCFICSFIHALGEEILIFISESVIKEKPVKEKVLKIFTIEERQVIHYVGGYCFRGFLKKSKRWTKNTEWGVIAEMIESRVLEGNGVPMCEQSDRAWTEAQNRVSLLFIGAPAMNFMLQLAQVVYNVDGDEDGCFKSDDILKDVFEDSVALLLWDELVGDSLDSMLSVRVLKGIVKSFTTTYARGVASEKLNNHLKKAYHAITLRHGVAPRQNH